MPFPIQRFQTDRGTEFFALKVQKKLKALCIKFRPNKPASPHLNGKVERSQKTDKTEFYPTINLKSNNIDDLLSEWQHYYNWDRPYSAHKGKSPIEKYLVRSMPTEKLSMRKIKQILQLYFESWLSRRAVSVSVDPVWLCG